MTLQPIKGLQINSHEWNLLKHKHFPNECFEMDCANHGQAAFGMGVINNLSRIHFAASIAHYESFRSRFSFASFFARFVCASPSYSTWETFVNLARIGTSYIF